MESGSSHATRLHLALRFIASEHSEKSAVPSIVKGKGNLHGLFEKTEGKD